MAVTKNIPVSQGNNINTVIDGTFKRLMLLGYEAVPSVVSSKTATIAVRKNCTKLYNFLGMSAEAKVTVMVVGDMIDVTVDNVWTNKSLAIALGWLLCFVPVVTGILGVVEQKTLSDNVLCALTEAAKTVNEDVASV